MYGFDVGLYECVGVGVVDYTAKLPLCAFLSCVWGSVGELCAYWEVVGSLKA